MPRRALAGVTAAVVVAATAVASAALGQVARPARKPAGSPSCDSLAKLALPNATITSAATVGAGTFVPPPTPNGGGGPAAADAALTYGKLPSFCRVAATLAPS